MIQPFYPRSRGAIRLLIFVLLSSFSSYVQAQNGSVTTTRSFSYTGQIVTWTVPSGVTSLTIEARGAEGIANRNSGRGAVLRGVVTVTPAQTLSVLVGGQPTGTGGLGGGGGSFVATTLNNTLQPLVIAGGGGGGGNLSTDSPAKHGQAGPAGAAATNAGGAGGTAGSGGRAGTGQYAAGGGGGLLTNGQSKGSFPGGNAFVNGGQGGGQGQTNFNGGFGGGGSGIVLFGSNDVSLAGGGGGGYSGGGGASANGDGSGGGYGGGGGSFNAGTNQFSATGATDGNSGNGLVTITYVQVLPIRYVKQGGTGSGTSWSDASGDLQAQINAQGVQQVWVAGGTYKPRPAGNTDRTISFNMKNNVAIYGGFAGTEATLNERILSRPASTTLSGDIGTIGDNSDNTYSIIVNENGINRSAKLDGFVITGGNAPLDGGGIYNSRSSPTLTNLTVVNNQTARNGGGIYNESGSRPLLTNCIFSNNAAANGGGMYNTGDGDNNSNSLVINCLFSHNTATGNGGAIYNENSASYMINCTLVDNKAVNGRGGGIYNTDNAGPELTNSVVWNNGGVNTFANATGNSSVKVSYSLLEPNVTGYSSATANQTTTTSPFVSMTDYQLRTGGPAINRGNNQAYQADSGPDKDLLGNTRIVDQTIDLGPYEFQGPFCQPIAITQQPASGSSVCAGSTVTAMVSVTGTSPTYQWYKDGVSLGAAQQAATLTLTNAQTSQSGSYSVVVTGSCNSVTSTAFSLTVNPLPVATITASPSTVLSCAQTSLTLTAGGGTGYVFSGPGIVSQGGNQAVVNTSGTYSVTVTSSGCSSTTSIAISQDNAAPSASLASSGTLSCTVTSVTLTASPGGQSYRFSNGATQVGTGPTATVTTAGVYSVTVLSGNGCSSVASTTVTGDQAVPTVSITPTSGTLTCASPTLTLTANTSASTLRWSNGQTTPSINVSTAGTYSVTATGANGCLATSNAVRIESSQSAPPATLVTSGGLSCAVTSVTLTANTGNGLSYRFSSGATQVSNGNTATVNVAGTYSVTVTNTATGCTNTASIVVGQDNSQPTVTVDPTSASLTCGVPSVTLTATTSAPSLRWSTGQTTASISASMAGTYSVTVTSANGCMAMAQATVSGTTDAPTAPTLAASPATATTNQPIVVTASGCSGGMINWALSGGSGQAGPTSFTLTQPGNYSLSASCTLNGCTSPYSPLLALQIRPGGFAITGVSMVNCQLTNPDRGEYQVQFTPQYTGQNASPISFAVVNELPTTTAPAPYSLRLYTDNPVITLVATQAGNGEARFAYNWLASCQSGTSPNQPPTTTGIPSQTIVQEQGYQLQLTSYFSDPDGQSLTFQASGLPTGLSLNGSVISGTPSQTGVSSINVTALDPGGLQVSTSFQLTVNPMPVTPPTGFAIVGVSTVSCQVISAGERRVTFTPQYAGVNGAPISFSVVNELVATTNPGPYSLNLYTDNPSITLSAQQGATVSTYRYNWLAVCTPAARVGSDEAGSRLQVRVLGNPIEGRTAEVEISGAAGQTVQINLVDLQGKSVHNQRIEQAGALERVSLPLGTSNGVLLLQVSTPTQRQQVKLLRTN